MIITIVAVLAGILVLLIVLVAFAGVVAWLLRGGSKPDPEAARAEGLKGLGYEPGPKGGWMRPIQGTTMHFSDGPSGLVWKMQLPRYNTMTMQIVEAGSRPVERQLETGIHAIDSRFHVGSPNGDRVVNLLAQPKLQKALLRTTNLALTLSADELVLEDPDRAGIKALGGDPLEAELNEHALMVNVINAFFGVLYSETGTTMDQFR